MAFTMLKTQHLETILGHFFSFEVSNIMSFTGRLELLCVIFLELRVSARTSPDFVVHLQELICSRTFGTTYDDDICI